MLLANYTITEEEDLEIKILNVEIDRIYLEFAKGAYIRSRAKWPEEGRRTDSFRWP